MDELNRDDRPPKPGPALPIRRVKADSVAVYTCFSRAIWGCWTHWNGSCTEPCMKNKSRCNGCRRGMPKRWKCYLHVWDHWHEDECFNELTPLATRMLESLVGIGHTLRGIVYKAKRSKGANNGRLTVTVEDSPVNQSKLFEPKDPMITLRKLWGLGDDDGHVDQELAG